jgi:ABC-type lipoprotein release transport system permease subunit
MTRRRRRALSAAGVLAASVVVGTGATVGYGLATGFDRAAARADLPHVVARFDVESRAEVDGRVRALPNLAARSYRREIKQVPLGAHGHATGKGIAQVVLGGRRGYAITQGHDVRPGEVVIERGLARAWHLRPGDLLDIAGATLPVGGIALAPDNVAFPLTVTPRVYLDERTVPGRFREPNLALLWLVDPARADVTLTQARATSFGIGNLAFVTREGIEVLLGQAAGIVISLLVAFSLVALAAAGTMLAAGAHADVQRRLPAFGVRRAIGFTPARLALAQAAETARTAVPAAVAGLAIGALAVAQPTRDLLAQLNEEPPGWALLPVLGVCLIAISALVCAAATWPAWRAARRPPATVLRGGVGLAAPRRARTAGLRDPMARVVGGRGSAATARAGAAPPAPPLRAPAAGLLGTGARFAVAARGRWAASVATVAVCAGVVGLMLALASLLERLRDDPGTLGKRYELTARLPPEDAAAVRAVPGVADAAPRYVTDAADSFRLGEPLRLIAYPGDHTRFEAPPLAEGRRLRSDAEAEVGVGLADALGLRPGATLAVQARSGAEVRFRVVGVVRALEHDGRLAYVRPTRLLAADPIVDSVLAVRLAPGADRARVSAALSALGAPPQPAAAATTRNAAFLGVLADVVRGVGLAVGLVCLYALVQALAMTARERRGAVALLRACGAGEWGVAAVLAGAALAVVVPAAALGVALHALVLGPLVGRLAAGFAALSLAPNRASVVVVVAGLAVLAAAATALVARRAARESIVTGLREE